MRHASNSIVQRSVEPVAIAKLSADLDVELTPRRLHFPSGAFCDVDGVSPDESVLVEVFARQAKLKAGQRGKVARDVLKLLTLREHRPGARLIVAFTEAAVVKDLSGSSWLAEALRTFKVEARFVAVPSAVRSTIAAAQVRQVMTNAVTGQRLRP